MLFYVNTKYSLLKFKHKQMIHWGRRNTMSNIYYWGDISIILLYVWKQGFIMYDLQG